MNMCISKKKDSFEPHYFDYNEVDRKPDNIEYIVHKKRSALSRKGIIAILPAFNEEISIGSMVLHARDHAERVIVVDDGSSDRTAEIAGLAGAEVIRHTKNMGKGVALKTCLLYTSDAADDLLCVDLGGRRTIKKKKNTMQEEG